MDKNDKSRKVGVEISAPSDVLFVMHGRTHTHTHTHTSTIFL